MSAWKSLVRQNLASLAQGRRLLERLDGTVYRRRSERLGSGWIGVHVRHVLDFHEQFLSGLDSGRVDYDTRRREPAVETDVARARERLHEISTRLAALAPPARRRELLVRMNDAGDAVWSASTVERELQAVLTHTVHHFAIVSLLLRDQGIEPEDGFGVAPATLLHWQNEEAGRCAR